MVRLWLNGRGQLRVEQGTMALDVRGNPDRRSRSQVASQGDSVDAGPRPGCGATLVVPPNLATSGRASQALFNARHARQCIARLATAQHTGVLAGALYPAWRCPVDLSWFSQQRRP